MENKLLESPLLSERIKLWNKYSGRVNQDGVKLDFMLKVHSEGPPSPSDCLPGRPNTNVPNAVKEMYRKENRTPKLPLKMDLMSTPDDEILSSTRTNDLQENGSSSLSEQEIWLSSLVSLQSSIVDYMSHNNLKSKLAPQVDRPSSEDISSLSSQRLKSQDPETIIDKLDIKLVKALASQMLQRLKSPNIDDQKSSSQDISLDDIVTSTPDMKAPEVKPPTSSSTIKRINLGDVRARAVICPVFIKSPIGIRGSTNGSAFAMCYRSLAIGVGSHNDMDLSLYGHCNFISASHAAIFYDEVSCPLKFGHFD